MKLTEKRRKLLKEAKELDIPTSWIDNNDEEHDIPNENLEYAIKHYKPRELKRVKEGFEKATNLQKRGIL